MCQPWVTGKSHVSNYKNNPAGSGLTGPPCDYRTERGVCGGERLEIGSFHSALFPL